ncbi:hypothetical protein ACVBEJ_00555 [Porticoccus sp. GXU_MW_L64]
MTTNIFIGGGVATGPAVAASLLSGESYGIIVWFGIFVMALSFALILSLLLNRHPSS